MTSLLVLCLALTSADTKEPDKIGPYVRLGRHKEEVIAVVVSKDGKTGWTFDAGGVLRRWGLSKGAEEKAPLLKLPELDAAAFSPDATRLAVAVDGKVTVLDVLTGKEVRALPVNKGIDFRSVALSEGGKRLLVEFDYGQVDVWRLEGGPLVRLCKEEDDPTPVFLSRDGAQLLLAGPRGRPVLVEVTEKGSTRRDLNKAEARGPLERAVFSPDGKEVVIVGLDNRVALFEVATGKKLGETKLKWALLAAPAISGDGKVVLINDGFTRMLVWRREKEGDKRALKEAEVETFPTPGKSHAALDQTGSVGLVSTGKDVYLWRDK